MAPAVRVAGGGRPPLRAPDHPQSRYAGDGQSAANHARRRPGRDRRGCEAGRAHSRRNPGQAANSIACGGCTPPPRRCAEAGCQAGEQENCTQENQVEAEGEEDSTSQTCSFSRCKGYRSAADSERGREFDREAGGQGNNRSTCARQEQAECGDRKNSGPTGSSIGWRTSTGTF